MRRGRPFQGGHADGEVVNGRTLVEYVGQNQWGHHLWFWRSACCDATQGPSTLAHLKRGAHCRVCALQRENNPRWKGHEELTGVYLRQTEYFAEKRGLAWAVTPDQLWAQWLRQGGRCVYTGWSLTHGVDASLDRLDNARGYEPDNVQWVHREVNQMKFARSDERFRELCRAVAEHDDRGVSWRAAS